jgi:DNA-binding CsgD family transcriptional regulator
LNVSDPALTDRLVDALSELDGILLVPMGEPADALVVMPDWEGFSTPATDRLTPREIEVLNLLAEGASNKGIARRLGISVHTAKYHVGSLLDKLDATGRTDAVTHAARLGIIQL